MAFSAPALRGALPDIVGDGDLNKANSILSTARSSAKLLGPAAGGILVASFGAGYAVAIDAFAFLLAAFLMFSLKLSSLPRNDSEKQSFFADLSEGWQQFRKIEWAKVGVMSWFALNFLTTSIWLVIGPAIANETFGPTVWGIIQSLRAAGLIIGGIIMYRIKTDRLLSYGFGALALGGLPFIVLGLQGPTFVLAAAALLAGLGSAIAGIAWDTSLQRYIPKKQLSRVLAIDDFGSFSSAPLGQLLAGPITTGLGLGVTAVVGGIIYCSIAVVTSIHPAVRRPKEMPEN